MTASQRHAWLLGLVGLLPFYVLAAVAGIAELRELAVTAYLAYGAVILSFLGGIAWGRALSASDAKAYRLSIVPSLVAWAALLMPQAAGIAMLAAGFGLQGWLDWRSLRDTSTAWFGRLRAVLSVAVLASMGLILVALFEF